MRLISVLVVLGTLLFANSEKIEINFQNLEINDFVKMVSKISDKNILLTEKIPGKVNFISVKPIDKNQIYNLLISVLRNKGYTLVDSKSGYLKIVRSSDATRESPPFKTQNGISQIQTDIIGVKNLSATQMLTQVRFLLSKYAKIAVSKEANSLIITDYPRNLKSIKKLINQLDSQKKMDIEFYVLKNSKVTSVLPKIKSIATSIYNQKMPSQKVSLFADAATNTLIIVSKQKIIDALLLHVKKLDKKNSVSQRSLHIVNLKNSDAKLMAKTLETVLSQKPIKKALKVKKDPKKPTFTADEETNILMIYASQEEFKEINTLIQALDVPRQQVYVSAKIVEISDIKSKQIGAKYGFEGGVVNSAGLYSFSTNLGSLVGASSTPLSSAIASKLEIPSITKGLALGATISLLSSEGAANILSEPSLLCVNNLQSSIYVGKTQSIITQGQTNNNSTNIINSTYTRQDIGLTLKIKPRISSDNKVLLDIKITKEDIEKGEGGGTPTTTKRDVQTTAIVKNGESIVIGGLIQEKNNNTSSKIPILGDIPVLGRAFKYDDGGRDKTSIVVILTPYIIDKSSDLSSLRKALSELNILETKMTQDMKKKKNVN